MKINHLSRSIAATIFCMAPVVASADDGSSNDSQQQQQQQSQDNRDQNPDENRRQSRGNQAVVVVPQGFVRMAVDYDRDGRMDGLETIYLFDLQQAKRQSDNRIASNMSQSDRSNKDQRDEKSSQSPKIRRMTVRGEIAKTMTSKLSGSNQEMMVVNLRGQGDKPQCVVLGPKDKFSDWDLSQGDSIEVQGVRARVNDRPVVMAQRVSFEGQDVNVDLPKPQNLKRARGEIQSVRTAKFRGYDQPFAIAEIKTPNGKTQTVNLGMESKYQDVELKEGEEVRVLARQGYVNGQPAMIAQRVYIAGQDISVPRPKQKTRFRQQQG